MDQILGFFETFHPFRHLLFAILILVLGSWLIKFVTHGLERAMARAHVEPTVRRFLTHMSSVILLTVVAIIALGQLGIQTTSLLALLSAAGLAIGLALEGSLTNFAAGLLLILFRPIKQGDFIGAAGVQGTVQEVQILTTTLYTTDNLRLTVPNAKIMQDTITNYSVTPTRRIQLTVGVSYDADLLQVKHVLAALMAAEPCILKDPAPFVGVATLGESSVDVVVQVWVQRADVLQVQCGFLEKIKRAFDQHGIGIPYPQRTLHLQTSSDPMQHHTGGKHA
jgi:small conductance mechanosensitive channel